MVNKASIIVTKNKLTPLLTRPNTKYLCKYNFPYKFLKMQSIAAGIFRKTGSNIFSTPKT